MELSIIAEGGGASGSYVLGSLMALKKLGLNRANVAVGVSASAGTMACFVADQLKEAYSMWTECVPSPHFISVLNPFRSLNLRNPGDNRPVVDLDYLFEYCKKNIPIDQEKIKRSKTLFVVPVTNLKTGKVEYVSNRANGVDLLNVLEASMKLPGISGDYIKLNEEFYFDGGYGDPLSVEIREVEDTRKIVILTGPEHLKTKFYNYFLSLKLDRFGSGGIELTPEAHDLVGEKSELYRKKLSLTKKLEEKGEAVVIGPTRTLDIFDTRRKTLEKIIREGYNDTICNESLRRLMGELRNSSNGDFCFSPAEQ